jgi:hypothetical protein
VHYLNVFAAFQKMEQQSLVSVNITSEAPVSSPPGQKISLVTFLLECLRPRAKEEPEPPQARAV